MKTKVITIRVMEKQWERWERLSKAENRSLSNWIETIVENKLNEKNGGRHERV